MPRFTSIVKVFTFILVPLLGCSPPPRPLPLPEATVLPQEVILTVEQKIRSSLDNALTTKWEKKESAPRKPTYKKLQLSDADKFHGISEEWKVSFFIIREFRFWIPISSSWSSWEEAELKCNIAVKKVKGEWVVGDNSFVQEKIEWKAKQPN